MPGEEGLQINIARPPALGQGQEAAQVDAKGSGNSRVATHWRFPGWVDSGKYWWCGGKTESIQSAPHGKKRSEHCFCFNQLYLACYTEAMAQILHPANVPYRPQRPSERTSLRGAKERTKEQRKGRKKDTRHLLPTKSQTLALTLVEPRKSKTAPTYL